MRLLLRCFSICLIGLAITTDAGACGSTASYRSVVVNHPPATVPPDGLLVRVRVTEGYVIPKTSEVHGLRAEILEADGQIPNGTIIEVKKRLGSMCDTWNDNWSTDPDITDGILTGYMVIKLVGQIENRIIVWPRLYRRAADWIEGDNSNGLWMHELVLRHTKQPQRWNARPNGEWKEIRFDKDAIIGNLENTNRLIREELDRLDNN